MAPRIADRVEQVKTLLGHGYPHRYIAQKTQMHANSVLKIAKDHGYSLGSGDRRLSRRVTSAFRRFLRMAPADRDLFFEMLREKDLLPVVRRRR